MPIFKMMLAGSFRPKVTLASGEPVAGFYSTRSGEARNQAIALGDAADAIQKELADMFGVSPADYQLEIESVEKVDDWPDFVSKGFTFYGAE
jgi:hypothetical protein